MPSTTVVKAFTREIFSRRKALRKTEPDLVMDDPEKVAAYTRAGREDGVMAPVYLFHCAQISEIIRPGDRVIDLGCGPATQLALVAKLNPESNFLGVDLSEEMLQKAKNHTSDLKLKNVDFLHQDITNLSSIKDQSVDAVMTTVVLHHLPDVAALEKVFAEIRRILKPGGGIYLVDFGHLKSEKSIEDFAYQYHDKQAELFTLDYLYSLQAAFWYDDFKALHNKYLKNQSSIYSTFIVPYMVAIKTRTRRDFDSDLQTKIDSLRNAMPVHHQNDIADLITFFKLGGMRSDYLR